MAEPNESIVFRERGAEKWSVGSKCFAIWSEDGLVYPATLISLDGEQGRIKFDGYGNEEEVELSTLLSGTAEQSWKEKQWVLGSRCRATWAEDGLVYPAVVVWIKGDRCRVQFDCYGNEEELDLCALLPPEKLKLNGNVTSKTVRDIAADIRDMESVLKEKVMKNPQEELPLPTLSKIPLKDRGDHESGREEREYRKTSNLKEEQKKPCNPFFSVPPPPFGSLDFLPPPPPPPFLRPPRKRLDEARDEFDLEVTTLFSMLLSWYLCGFHTGWYMAMQQSKSNQEMTDRKEQGAK